jgi:hypothetical protein
VKPSTRWQLLRRLAWWLATASLGEEWRGALTSRVEQSGKMGMEKRGHNEEGKTKSASTSRV